MHEGRKEIRKLTPKALVALRSDPSRKGVILHISRDGRTASVQFENYPRPTTHTADGLIFVAPSAQLGLFGLAD
jgi:hypothetical protein